MGNFGGEGKETEQPSVTRKRMSLLLLQTADGNPVAVRTATLMPEYAEMSWRWRCETLGWRCETLGWRCEALGWHCETLGWRRETLGWRREML